MRVLYPALILFLHAVPKQEARCLCSTTPADGPGAGPLARPRGSAGPGCLHNTHVWGQIRRSSFSFCAAGWLR